MAKAIVAGASGLIGGLLVDTLTQSPVYKEVVVLVRKELPIIGNKVKLLVVDFDRLEDYEKEINGHAIFCCLGSTRSKTPDLNAYRKIDHDYSLQLAQMAAKNGVEQFHLVSALGANTASGNFYTKMKGETEEDIKKTGVKCIHIYQPSVLIGDRKEKRVTERTLIRLMGFINLFLWGGLRKYRSIPAATVAVAMYKQSLTRREGVFIHLSDEIKEIA